MNKIMAALDKKFAGQAAARLDTYAGKMDLLKVAAANATEIIGKGLIDALTALGKDNSIDQAANSMNGFANAIANTAKGMGELIGQVKQIIDSDVGKFLLAITALLTLGKKQLILGTAGLIAYDIGKTPKSTSNFTYGAGNPRADLVLQKKLTAAKKEEYNILVASNKTKSEIDKLKDKFDLERIGLTVALNNATDAETKLRIQAQLAILDNNEALAKKILAEMEAAEAAKKLGDAAAQLEAAFRKTIADLAIYDPVRNIAPGQTGLFPSNVSNVPSVPFVGTPFGQAGGNTGAINATVELVMSPNAGDFEQLIYNSFLINQKNGNSQTVNGAV
jgi:hypothetical protein